MTSPDIDTQIEMKTEHLQEQHFTAVLVFGQGPVQEAESVPEVGRKGLNVYARLTALAAAEMLQEGLTDRVIVSGGQTGARAGTPEAKTEAELMADVITRYLSAGSDEPGTFMAKGEKKRIRDVIAIENKAKDSLQNLAFILNEYGVSPDASIAFLGIGFHAYDTWSGAGEGRLEVLADLFGIDVSVYSAEGMLRSLVVSGRDEHGFVHRQLTRLTTISLTDPVSRLKSEQEAVLVRGLHRGDWLRIAPFLADPQRVKTMILHDPYVLQVLAEQLRIDAEAIGAMESSEVLKKLAELRVEGSVGYGEVKEAVFQRFQELADETGIDYMGMYGKPTATY